MTVLYWYLQIIVSFDVTHTQNLFFSESRGYFFYLSIFFLIFNVFYFSLTPCIYKARNLVMHISMSPVTLLSPDVQLCINRRFAGSMSILLSSLRTLHLTSHSPVGWTTLTKLKLLLRLTRIRRSSYRYHFILTLYFFSAAMYGSNVRVETNVYPAQWDPGARLFSPVSADNSTFRFYLCNRPSPSPRVFSYSHTKRSPFVFEYMLNNH